jgi:flagellar motor switch protein FliN/FliY
LRAERARMTVSQSDIDALLSSAAELEADGERGQTAPAAGSAPPDAAARSASIPQPPPADPDRPDLARIFRMQVPVIVTLAERDATVGSVLSLTTGSIIEFDVRADSEFRLMIANKCVGTGQAVKAGEHFGLRLTRVGGLDRRIRAMGGG